MVNELASDLNNLFGRLACAEDNFWKTFPQRTVRVHLGKTNIRHRRGLESAQNFFAGDASGAELFQQLSGFGRRHLATMPKAIHVVTRDLSLLEVY